MKGKIGKHILGWFIVMGLMAGIGTLFNNLVLWYKRTTRFNRLVVNVIFITICIYMLTMYKDESAADEKWRTESNTHTFTSQNSRDLQAIDSLRRLQK